MTTTSRLVRIFISSTFRDFMEERDLLVKQVFPELRRRCRSRFVELLEVDLRWGITEDQSMQGATLKICLQEIDRCRPSSPVFFIGLLGERYGWVPPPDYYKPEVLEDPTLAWVKEHITGSSVTELEVLHGVLNKPAMTSRAFFYFRRDGYEKRDWGEIHKSYPYLKPVDFTNEAESDPQTASARQRSLKDRVRSAGLQHEPRDYDSPQEMASLALEALWAQIDAAFPLSEVPDALEQEALDHQVFCESRTRAYVEREGLFAGLDAHAGGEGPNGRVVEGASGSGKSALLAAWLIRNHDRVFFYHVVGATPRSASAEAILHRLFGALRKRAVLPQSASMPQDRDAMVAALPGWLEQLSRAGGGILLLDALNQLGTARDRELKWWPTEWPENVRVVFSTLPGDVWREMEHRGWTVDRWLLRVPELQSVEKRSIMNNYLQLFARSLAPSLQEKIVSAPQTTNPLFLRTVLDELRLRSRHEDLGRNLAEMLACADPAELFVHVLKNLERDYTPKDHPYMVHRVLGLMGAARRGLTEREILELLSDADKPAQQPLPRHYWAPLYLALEDSLVSREGELGFFHDYLRQAIWREYLDEPNERVSAHTRLAAPIKRWRESDAFSSSLQAYAFEHGLGHLLEVKQVQEAVALILNQLYRQNAAVTLCGAEPVQRDVDRVRKAAALAGSCTASQSAQLTVRALTGWEELMMHLRDVLDQRAAQGKWEQVMEMAAAEDDVRLRLLLAFRAISRGHAPADNNDFVRLRALMCRWAVDSGKREEWSALVDMLMPVRDCPLVDPRNPRESLI